MSRPFAEGGASGSNQQPTISKFLNASVYPRSRLSPHGVTNSAILREDDQNTDAEDGEVIPLDHSQVSSPLRPSVVQGKRVVFSANFQSPPPRDASPNSSDDEIPRSFMIEESPTAKRRAYSSRASRTRSSRKHPILPITNVVSTPPRPSELDEETEDQDAPLLGLAPKPSHGLSPYERALWNWVNVYNLDAYLQEVRNLRIISISRP